MANVNFYLKNPSEQSETPINLIFRYNGKKLKYATGALISPRYWNEAKQRAKKSYTGSPELNAYLSDIENKVDRIYSNQYNANGVIPSIEFMRESLNKALKRTKVHGKSFSDLFEGFIEQAKTTKRLTTLKKYRTTLNYLQEFAHKKRVSLSFEFIDSNFYEKFVKYLLEEVQQTNNTVGKYIQTLKTFLNYATEKGINTRFDYKKFKVFKEDTDIIALTDEELNAMSELDLTKREGLARARDLFLFGCYTGMRFSDISKIKPVNIKGDYVEINTHKTKSNNRIPLSNLAKKILRKYENELPNSISNQKLNDHLKELGKLAEIDEFTQRTRHRGALSVSNTQPKYAFIGTHTARRTFVTLSLEKGMRPELVMEITGHKTWQSFKRYVSVTDKVKRVELNRVWGGTKMVAN